MSYFRDMGMYLCSVREQTAKGLISVSLLKVSYFGYADPAQLLSRPYYSESRSPPPIPYDLFNPLKA